MKKRDVFSKVHAEGLFALNPQRRRIAALTMGTQFNPGFDGASNALLDLLVHLRDRGSEVSIYDFVPQDLRDARLAHRSGGSHSVRLRGSVRGIEVTREVLPFGWSALSERQHDVIALMMGAMAKDGVDYTITLDKAFSTLFAAYASAIPGAHFFNSLANVKRFTLAHPLWKAILKKRNVYAVSGFVQGTLKEFLDVDAAVFPPVIDFSRYRVERRDRRRNVVGFYTVGGPRYKGNEIVNRVAERLPEYPFLVVGRDYLFPDEQLPKNIEYIGQLTDMKAFYEQISVLLVPSIVDDAFPRVILEAAVNGIPVVANKIGGIPEAMGESGIIVDAGPGGYADADTVAAKYVLAIRKLFGDDQRYEYESKRALIRAREYQRAQDEQITRLQATFGERVSVTTATAGSTHEIDC